MAAGDAVVGIDIVARLDGLREEMAKIPDIGAKEARTLTAALSREIKAAQRAVTSVAKTSTVATQAAAKSAGQMRMAVQSTAQQIPDVVSQLASGTGALQVFTQQGLQVAQVNMGLLTSTLQAAPVAFGTLGAAVGIAAVAYTAYAREIRLAEEVQATYTAQAKALEGTERRIADVRLQLAHATGKLTDAELRRAQASLAAQRSVLEFADAQKDQRRELTETTETWGKFGDTVDALRERGTVLDNVVAGVVESLTGASAKTNAAREQIDTLNRAVQKEAELQKELRGLLEQNAAAEDRNTAAKRAGKDASKDAAAAAKEEARAYAEAVRTRAAAIEELDRIRRDSTLATMSDEERLNAVYQEQLDRIAELEATTWDFARAESARTALALEHEQDLADLRKRNADERARQDADAARAQQEALTKQIDGIAQAGTYAQQGMAAVSSSMADAYADAADNVSRLETQLAAGEEFYTEAQKDELRKRIANQQKAARDAWRREKNWSMAAAAVNLAVAITKAATSAPWPANLASMAGAAASTAPQLIAIGAQQPALDTGGAVQPDRVVRHVQPGEWVSSKVGRSVMGDEALKRADSGIAPRRDVYAVSVYGHNRVVTRWEDDRLSMGGPTDRAIRQAVSSTGGIVGHRAR